MKRSKNKKNGKVLKYIKKCIPYFMQVKGSIIILVILSLFFSVINSLFPAFIASVLDLVTSGKFDKAILYGTIVIGVSIFTDLVSVPFRNAFVKIQNTVSNSIKKDVINAYFMIRNKELIKTSSGLFLTRITSDPDMIVSAFSAIRANISTILSNLFVFIYIFYLHPVLGLITVIGTILVYVVEKKAMDNWNAHRKEIKKDKEDNTTVINEGIKGVLDIKLLNITDYFKDKINGNFNSMYDKTIRANKKDSNYSFLRDFVVDAFTYIVIVVGILFAKNDVISMSSVIALFMYKDRLFTSVLYLAWSERQLKEFSLSAERIFEVIDKYPKEKYGNVRINDFKGNIQFKNVKFSYDKDPVLKGISFSVDERDTVAIVGKSGSGKTTIINLISKLYTADYGSILIDGVNINQIDKFTLRNNIAVIPQKPYLFNVTIRENLLMVCPDASHKQLENVCKICEIHDYIMSLPKGYNTLVGEGGVNLSGGEAQRIAIARALLMKSKIILFDEATSALDNETQANIQKAINNISDEYTMIIIAHRLSTIKDCNKIIVIDDGKVVGEGNHKELYKNNEIYRTLYENELHE